MADPAFQMTPADYPFIKKENVRYVGINMSELAVGHSLDSDRISMEESKVLFAQFIDRFLDRNDNVEVILIPHVNMTGPQDDLNFLKPVLTECTHQDRIHLFPAGLGPIRYVAEMFCDRVAATRIYQKERYTDAAAYDYYIRSEGHYLIHPNTAALIKSLLKMLRDEGEEKTFDYIRR